jgi:hypothetical protein
VAEYKNRRDILPISTQHTKKDKIVIKTVIFEGIHEALLLEPSCRALLPENPEENLITS